MYAHLGPEVVGVCHDEQRSRLMLRRRHEQIETDWASQLARGSEL